MFNAKKYLKIRKLEAVLYGGPEAVEFNYEKDASYIGDTRNRSRDYHIHKDNFEMQNNNIESDSIREEIDNWYEYKYDSLHNQIIFKSISE